MHRRYVTPTARACREFNKRGIRQMWSQQQREELDRRARQGETVVPGGTGGTGGKSLEAQEHLAEGGEARKQQIGQEGYQEMGRKGGLSTTDESGGERASREGIPIDESKFRTGSRVKSFAKR